MRNPLNNAGVSQQNQSWKLLIPSLLSVFSILFVSANVFAQGTRPTPTPTSDLPAVISRDSDSVRTRNQDDVNEVDSDSTNNSINLPRQDTKQNAKKSG